MMIVIAYNHNGKVVSIVNAKSEELAKAFWQGRGIIYNTINNLDDKKTFTSLDEHPTGVYPIFETIELIAGRCNNEAKLLCVK